MKKFSVAFPFLAITQTGSVFVCAGGEDMALPAEIPFAVGVKSALKDEGRVD